MSRKKQRFNVCEEGNLEKPGLEVEGYVIQEGGLGVHPSLGALGFQVKRGNWTITHLPTGGSFRTAIPFKEEAIRKARKLADMLNWAEIKTLPEWDAWCKGNPDKVQQAKAILVGKEVN